MRTLERQSTVRSITALCLGVIAAFCVLQLLFFYQHGFSFTVVFHIDRWYLVRGLSYIALGLLAVRTWRFLRAGVAELRITRNDVFYFILGITVMAIAFIVWKLQEGPEVDFKFTPYVVVPAFYVVALIAYLGIEAIEWRSNNALERP